MSSQVIALCKRFVVLISTIVGVITTIDFSVKLCQKIFQYIMRPRIIWGLLDCPSSKEAHYYILVKTWDKELQQSIKFTLIPHALQQFDYAVVVRSFYEPIGREELSKIGINEQVIENNKEISFKLLGDHVYRIVIQVSGGPRGTLVCDNITLKFNVPDTKIKRKDQKPPLEKYIFLVNWWLNFKR